MEFTHALVAAARGEQTPVLIMDRSLLRQAYRELGASLPGAEVYYSVKANPDPQVLAVLADSGCGMEISSSQELGAVLGLGVAPERIISSNPVKAPEFIRQAYAAGIDRFAFDSEDELVKLAHWAPRSRVYPRVTVDNSESDWPLDDKYGVPPSEGARLLQMAVGLGLEPYGVTFHVGSQCRSAEAWVDAVRACAPIFRTLESSGHRPKVLNLGGGQPVHHRKPIPTLARIGQRIRETVAELFGDRAPRLAVEPGRALVGHAGALVTSVIGRARRGDRTWLYLDAGVFNALMESIQGIEYELRTEREGPPKPFVLAGPSCDSVDKISGCEELPELEVGERVYVLNAGAYTLSYASSFNGFGPPAVKLVDNLAEEAAGEQASGQAGEGDVELGGRFQSPSHSPLASRY